MKDTTILLNTRTPKDEGKYIKFDAKIDDEGGGGGSSNLITIIAVPNEDDFDISIDGHEELETAEQINDFLVENFDAPMELLQPAPEETMSPDIRINISIKQVSPADVSPKPLFGCSGNAIVQGALASYSLNTVYTSGNPGTYSISITPAMYQLQPLSI